MVSAAADCAPRPHLEPLLQPGSVLLLGEIHGTEEGPATLRDVACHALAAELPVVVALEVWESEGERVAAFLSSDGGPEAEAALLAGPFWTRPAQDGRASEAMLELLRFARERRAAGDPLRVELIDDPEPGTARDAHMAERLGELVTQGAEGLVVSLTGNAHNRITRGTPWDEEHEPMGFLLAGDQPERRIVSLDLATTGGTAWICQGVKPEDCGRTELGGSGREEPAVELFDEGARKPYSGRLHIGRITASPPAVGTPGG